MRMISIVVSVLVFAGACAPAARPAGFVGGTILAITGGLLVANMGSGCESDDAVDPITAPITVGAEAVGCVSSAVAAVTVGSAMVLSGLVVFSAAALSPSAPTAPSEPAAPPVEEEKPVWPPLGPSRSPSAPSGSPLAFH